MLILTIDSSGMDRGGRAVYLLYCTVRYVCVQDGVHSEDHPPIRIPPNYPSVSISSVRIKSGLSSYLSSIYP
jgi:hypothetical protein